MKKGIFIQYYYVRFKYGGLSIKHVLNTYGVFSNNLSNLDKKSEAAPKRDLTEIKFCCWKLLLKTTHQVL